MRWADYLVTGQVPGRIRPCIPPPTSRYQHSGRARSAFTGVIDNTDVFFKLAQAAVKGPAAPATFGSERRLRKR